MNPIPPRSGKYCPQCSTMARPDAVHCAHCGHQFSTGLVAASPESLSEPLTEENIHKTRMFTLPTFIPRPPAAEDRTSTPALSEEEVAALEKALATGRRTRSVWPYAAGTFILLLTLALWWWLTGHL